MPLIDDEDEDVRLRATAGLSVPADDEPAQGPVVDALLEALGDSCADVRDRAAFALGVQRDVDSTEVRDALLARFSDDDEADTPGEAAVGLARRGDPRALKRLLERLSDADVGNLWVEAAAELGNARLLPVLLQLKSSGWQVVAVGVQAGPIQTRGPGQLERLRATSEMCPIGAAGHTARCAHSVHTFLE